MASLVDNLIAAISRLSAPRQKRVALLVDAYERGFISFFDASSDLIDLEMADVLGDQIVAHHSTSKEALSKDKFEFALERSYTECLREAIMPDSRTHPYDMIIEGNRFSIKTEAAKAIKPKFLHVSKWMELGKGEWDIQSQLNRFLQHLKGYDRVIVLRKMNKSDVITYQLVEIPMSVLSMAASANVRIRLKAVKILNRLMEMLHLIVENSFFSCISTAAEKENYS